MQIRSLRALARYLDASSVTKDSIAHRIYKRTTCGAGFTIFEPKVRIEERRYRASLVHGEHGACVARIDLVVDHNRSRPARQPLPQPVIDMLAIEAAGGRTPMPALVSPAEPVSLEYLRSQIASMEEIYIEKDLPRELVIAFNVKVPLSIAPSKRRATGIRVCGYCEGADAELPTYSLDFPFTEEEFEAALQSCDDDADQLWNETHGCARCGDEELSGYRAVNPDCKSCGGDGIVS